MQRYKIPQNVQVEDKIFGNILTLRQLITIGLGGAISYVVYTALARTYQLNFLEMGIIGIPLYITVAFAFVRIGPISLLKFSLLFIEYILKPEKRVWTREGSYMLDLASPITKKVKTNKIQNTKNGEKPSITKEELENLGKNEKQKTLKDLSNALNFSKSIHQK